MSVSVKIPQSEIDKLEKAMKRFKSLKAQEIKNAMAAAGLEMESVAAQNAPVQYGRLRQSIRYSPTNGGLGAKAATNVEYAVYQNNGTAKIAGKHFMEKGFQAGVNKLMSKLK